MEGNWTNSSVDCQVKKITGFTIDINNMAYTDNRNVHEYISRRRGFECSILLNFFFQSCLHQAKIFLLLFFVGFPTSKAADVTCAGRNYSINGSEAISTAANCNIMHRSEAYVQDGYMNLYYFLFILFVFFGIGILLTPFYRPRSYHPRNDGSQFDQEEDLADDDTSAINSDYTSNWKSQCPTAVDCVSLNISQSKHSNNDQLEDSLQDPISHSVAVGLQGLVPRLGRTILKQPTSSFTFLPDHQQPLSSVAVYHYQAKKFTLLEHGVEIPESDRFPTTTKIVSGTRQGAVIRPILSQDDAFSCISTNEEESLCMPIKDKSVYTLNEDKETRCNDSSAKIIEQEEVAGIEDTDADITSINIETSVCLGRNDLLTFCCNVGIQSVSPDIQQEYFLPLQPLEEISCPEGNNTNSISSPSYHT